MADLVSVIVPVYNGATFLAQTLESALCQRNVEVELIVVDDGSSDQSIGIAQHYQAQVVQQANQGPGAARNTGVRYANGDHLAFLDQDDLWHSDKLQLQLQALKTGDYAVCSAKQILEPDAMAFQGIIREGYQQKAVALTPSALLVTRAVFERVGFFDAHLFATSDVKWFGQAVALGLRMVYPEEVLLTKRFHAKNQGHDVQTGQDELFRVLREKLKKRGAL